MRLLVFDDPTSVRSDQVALCCGKERRKSSSGPGVFGAPVPVEVDGLRSVETTPVRLNQLVPSWRQTPTVGVANAPGLLTETCCWPLVARSLVATKTSLALPGSTTMRVAD